MDLALYDLLLAPLFMIFGFLCFRRRISYRVSLFLGLILLVATAVLVILDTQYGSTIAAVAYYFLSVGVGLALLEYRTDRKRSPLSSHLRLSVYLSVRTV